MSAAVRRRNGPGASAPSFDPSTPAQSYQFVAAIGVPLLSDPGQAFTTQRSFTVLAGEGAPTITSGWAKWGIIDRPRREGMTVLQGYDPIIMDVPVRFDDVVHQAGADLERDIQILHWMAGRGKLYGSGSIRIGAAGAGDSPLVRVFSSDGAGNQSALIPPDVHDLRWVISGLAFDPNPLRGPHGHRIRQDATITLTQYVGAPGTSLDSASNRSRVRRALRDEYRYFPVTTANNTIRKIVTFEAPRSSIRFAASASRIIVPEGTGCVNGSTSSMRPSPAAATLARK